MSGLYDIPRQFIIDLADRGVIHFTFYYAFVVNGFLCAIARRQGQSGRQYLAQAWGSYPTVGGVPVVPDEKATEIVLHDHRSEP